MASEVCMHLSINIKTLNFSGAKSKIKHHLHGTGSPIQQVQQSTPFPIYQVICLMDLRTYLVKNEIYEFIFYIHELYKLIAF